MIGITRIPNSNNDVKKIIKNKKNQISFVQIKISSKISLEIFNDFLIIINYIDDTYK